MSIFRRSMMQSDRPIRTYKAKFQMKFDPETYGTDNYALTGEALENPSGASGYTGYGQILNYGLGFVITYGTHEILTPSGGIAYHNLRLTQELDKNLSVHLEITNETNGKKAVYNDIILAGTETGGLYNTGTGYGVIAVKLIHTENDEEFELENTTTEDEEFVCAGAQHSKYTSVSASTVGRVSYLQFTSYNSISRLLIKSKHNLLTNNNPTIYTVEVTLKSSESYAENSFTIWNMGSADSISTGSKSNNSYIVRCNCKYGEFVGDSIFLDNRLEGVE